MPPPRAAAKKSAEVLRFRCDGVNYALDRDEITPRIERELYRATELTPAQCFDAMLGGAKFAISALVFMARRQAGDNVAYQPIEDALFKSMQAEGDDFDLAVIEDDDDGEGGDAAPPA